MKIVATAEAALLLEAEGGRIYVRTDRSRCCSGPMTYLLTSTDPVEGHQFELVGGEGFECWFDPGGLAPPMRYISMSRAGERSALRRTGTVAPSRSRSRHHLDAVAVGRNGPTQIGAPKSARPT